MDTNQNDQNISPPSTPEPAPPHSSQEEMSGGTSIATMMEMFKQLMKEQAQEQKETARAQNGLLLTQITTRLDQQITKMDERSKKLNTRLDQRSTKMNERSKELNTRLDQQSEGLNVLTSKMDQQTEYLKTQVSSGRTHKLNQETEPVSKEVSRELKEEFHVQLEQESTKENKHATTSKEPKLLNSQDKFQDKVIEKQVRVQEEITPQQIHEQIHECKRSDQENADTHKESMSEINCKIKANDCQRVSQKCGTIKEITPRQEQREKMQITHIETPFDNSILEIHDNQKWTTQTKPAAQPEETTVRDNLANKTSVTMTEGIIFELPEAEQITATMISGLVTANLSKQAPKLPVFEEIRSDQRHEEEDKIQQLLDQAQRYPNQQIAFQLYISPAPVIEEFGRKQPKPFQLRNERYLTKNVSHSLKEALQRFLICSKYKGPPPEKGPP